jgi:DNA polymerase-3 subunit delta'
MTSLAELEKHQPEAVAHIQQVFASGRLHHAYVLAGPDSGDCSALAQAMVERALCQETQDPENCICRKKLRGGNHPDFISIEPDDKGIIRIDAIRDIASRLSLKAIESERKVILIQGADTMNPAAQNALLKTLEEPPGPCCFILTVKRFRSLLPTVRSRSQRIRLQAPSPEKAIQTLVEGGVDSEVAPVLAAIVGTDVDAALEKVDQGAAEILSTLKEAIASPNLGEVTDIAEDIGNPRPRADLTFELLSVELRNQLAHLQGVSTGAHLGEALPNLKLANILSAIERLEQLQKKWVFNPNRRLGLESVLLCLKGSHS